jgi:hypothetical protein
MIAMRKICYCALPALLICLVWAATQQFVHVQIGADKIELHSSQIVLPMKIFGGRPTIDLTINGKGPFTFILDSGAQGSLINPDLAAELNLEPQGEMHVGSPADSVGSIVKLYQATKITAGELEITGLRLFAMPLPRISGNGVLPRGVLSPAIFKGILLTFDYPRGRVVLEKGQLPAADGAQVFEYKADRRLPTVPVFMAGKEFDLYLDLGAPGTIVLPGKEAAGLPLETAPTKLPSMRLVTGEIPLVGAKLDGKATLGRYSFDHPMIAFGEGLPVGNIGAALLGRFAITLDVVNRRIRISE